MTRPLSRFQLANVEQRHAHILTGRYRGLQQRHDASARDVCATHRAHAGAVQLADRGAWSDATGWCHVRGSFLAVARPQLRRRLSQTLLRAAPAIDSPSAPARLLAPLRTSGHLPLIPTNRLINPWTECRCRGWIPCAAACTHQSRVSAELHHGQPRRRPKGCAARRRLARLRTVRTRIAHCG
jgi:hypothetical protein